MKKEQITLVPGCVIFKNYFKDIDHIMDMILLSKNDDTIFEESWKDWDPWGNMVEIVHSSDKNIDSPFVKEISSVFWDVVKSYSTINKNKDLSSNYMNNILLQEYDLGKDWIRSYDDRGRTLSMLHHSDLAPWYKYPPYLYTLTMYFNDNYDGGELSFINPESIVEKQWQDKSGEILEYWEIDEPVVYKPQKGDVVMFKSDMIHGVTSITNGNKFFATCFLSVIHKDVSIEEIEKYNFDGFINERQNMYIYNNVDDLWRDKQQRLAVVRKN